MMQQQKQRILFVVNSLNIGGTEKIVIETCNGLNFTKYDVTVVCLSPYDSLNSIFNVVMPAKEISITYFPYTFDHDYSLIGYFKLLLRKGSHPLLKPIVDHINSLRPQIIHFHTSPRELIIGNRLNYKSKKIFTDHSLRIHLKEYPKIKIFILSRILKRLYRKWNVITVSEEIRNNLFRLKIINRKLNILVIPNAIDTDLYQNASAKNISGLSVIYVSRIAEGKGHRDLIKAWGLLKGIPQKKLMIVGPDSLKGEIQRLVNEYGFNDTIEFTGAVTNSKEWLQKANIAVFPSYKEGLPLSLLEKMAMKLPVIAYDITELAAIIHHKQTGILSKTGDATSLAENISFLFHNKELRDKIGENARSYVLKHHHIKNVHKQIENFYENIQLT